MHPFPVDKRDQGCSHVGGTTHIPTIASLRLAMDFPGYGPVKVSSTYPLVPVRLRLSPCLMKK